MIDGSCYREGRNRKIFVIFGWHCLWFLPFIPSHFPSLSSRVKCWTGKDSEQKKQKNKNIENMTDWRFPFLSISPGVACPFSTFSLFPFSILPYNSSFWHFSFFIIFIWACHMVPLSFLSISISVSFPFCFFFSFGAFSSCIVLPGHSEWVLVCLCMS